MLDLDMGTLQSNDEGLALNDTGSIKLVSTPIPDEHPLSTATYEMESEEMISISALNYTVSFTGPEAITQDGYSSVVVELTDTAGHPLAKVKFNELDGDLCLELVDSFLHPEEKVQDPWRELRTPECLNGSTEETDEVQPGQKRTVLKGDVLLAAIRHARDNDINIELTLEPEPEPNSSTAEIAQQIAACKDPGHSKEVGSDAEPEILESTRDFVSAYQRRVDVYGVQNAQRREVQAFLDAQPSIRCLDFNSDVVKEVNVQSEKGLAELHETFGATRWIDISKPNDEILAVLQSDFGVPEEFIQNIKTSDGIAHHQELNGYLLLGQHTLREKGGEIEEQEVHFIFKDNVIISITNETVDVLRQSYERIAADKHPPRSPQDAYIEAAYDFLVNNKTIPQQTANWVSRTLSTVAHDPLVERPGIRQQRLDTTGKINRMERIFAGQNELLNVVDAFYAKEERSARSTKLEQTIETGLANLEKRLENQKSQISEMQGIRHAAVESLIAKTLFVIGGISFASQWSPLINNHLGIPTTFGQAIGITTTTLSLGALAYGYKWLFHRKDRDAPPAS